MKTFPTTQEIDQMAEKLRMAVVETLSLSESAKVFVGNEEKLFLMALFQKLPDSSHKTSIKFDRYKHLTNFKMMDIGSDEITNRSAIKKRQNLREKSRQLLISTRGFLIKIKNYIFLSRKLKNTSTIIHYAGHLRYGAFVTPN